MVNIYPQEKQRLLTADELATSRNQFSMGLNSISATVVEAHPSSLGVDVLSERFSQKANHVAGT